MKLTKSQRVKAIQDISAHLESDDWSLIDLTLKQFGFPISNEWTGDKKSYVVQMIGDAKDADLVELGQHFGMQLAGEDIAAVANLDTPYWQEGQAKVFISHLTAHREQAADVQTELSRYGMSGFVAHNDIHPTTEWQIEIETALATCDMLVALIHPDFVSSKWCDQEIGYALGRGVPVFVVRCGVDPHGFVSRFQAFNGTGKTPRQLAKELFEAAIVHKKLQERMADVVVNLFINSGSFLAARQRVGYVDQLKVWDAGYSAQLIKAVKSNDQISGAWDVPDQVKAILAKWK